MADINKIAERDLASIINDIDARIEEIDRELQLVEKKAAEELELKINEYMQISTMQVAIDPESLKRHIRILSSKKRKNLEEAKSKYNFLKRNVERTKNSIGSSAVY